MAHPGIKKGYPQAWQCPKPIHPPCGDPPHPSFRGDIVIWLGAIDCPKNCETLVLNTEEISQQQVGIYCTPNTPGIFRHISLNVRRDTPGDSQIALSNVEVHNPTNDSGLPRWGQIDNGLTFDSLAYGFTGTAEIDVDGTGIAAGNPHNEELPWYNDLAEAFLFATLTYNVNVRRVDLPDFLARDLLYLQISEFGNGLGGNIFNSSMFGCCYNDCLQDENENPGTVEFVECANVLFGRFDLLLSTCAAQFGNECYSGDDLDVDSTTEDAAAGFRDVPREANGTACK